jgi:hypothetical protein
LIRRLRLVIDGWPRCSHPLRVLFLFRFSYWLPFRRCCAPRGHVKLEPSSPTSFFSVATLLTCSCSGLVESGLAPERPSIVLTHDPMWFANVPRGTHLTLAGHTHGGQISLPGIGILKNASKAPLRWTHGLIRERGQYLYVTSGIGTSGVPSRWRVRLEFVVLDVTGPSVAAISTVGAATGCLSASTV